MPRLWVGQTPDGLFVDFFGSPMDEGLDALLDALAAPEVSANLVGATLRGPDEGANGTCNWNLRPFVDAVASLPRLRTFAVEQGGSSDHNTHIIAEDYEEGGVLGRLLDKAPSLERLEVPSCPGPNFFQTDVRPLHSVSVRAGYHHQGFIDKLANATNLPRLRSIEYGEGIGPGFERLARVAFPCYAQLLRSPKH